ncbi:MAG: hypothetical protein ACRDP4_02740 [Nocardioidaceae bacterium]
MIGAITVVLVLYKTVEWWAPDSFVLTAGILAGAGAGTLKALALIPLTTQNPLVAAIGLFTLPFAPPAGTSAGRSAEPRRNHRLFVMPGAPAVWSGPLPTTSSSSPARELVEAEPAKTNNGSEGAAVPTVALDTSRPALTGLQRLLADAARGTSEEGVNDGTA